MNLPIV